MTLPDSAKINCRNHDVLDGTGLVVEINHRKTYRTYLYGYSDECREAAQMRGIVEIIGLEFDSGEEKCRTAEWFPCATYLREKKLSGAVE